MKNSSQADRVAILSGLSEIPDHSAPVASIKLEGEQAEKRATEVVAWLVAGKHALVGGGVLILTPKGQKFAARVAELLTKAYKETEV